MQDQIQETVTVQYAKPYIKMYKIYDNTTLYIETVRVVVYSSASVLYIAPYVSNPAADYAPAVIYRDGYINQNADPSEIGFVNVTGIHAEPTVIDCQTYNVVAFEVPADEPFNITFVIGKGDVPVLQVYASIPFEGFHQVYSIVIQPNVSSS